MQILAEGTSPGGEADRNISNYLNSTRSFQIFAVIFGVTKTNPDIKSGQTTGNPPLSTGPTYQLRNDLQLSICLSFL